MNEEQDEDISPEEKERRALRRQHVMLVYQALKPIVTHPSWEHILDVEKSLRDEIAHGAMRAGGQETMDYWRGRYDGSRGLLAKINELVSAGATIEREEAESLASEKLKAEILEQKVRDAQKRRGGDEEDGILG